MSDPSGKLSSGTIIAGRYELIAEVGRGGFGVVWRARQMNMDRDVAIKILPPRFLSIPDVVARFKREARLASRLRHPNTITLHDWGQSDDLLYIVMELLTGEDLADVLRAAGRLEPRRVVNIVRQALKSLAEAHEQGIVHRDLKPENIFLSEVGEDRDVVKVLDFGIAKMALPQPEDATDEKNRALTMSGSTVGTPTYMSPEQAAGEDVDGQTDLYALGIIMYEMLDGRPPFANRDPVRVMRAHLFDEVPPFRDPQLHGTLLDRVVRKALAKDKSERFKTANEFLLALASDVVARPVLHGLNIGSLDEPSTQEFEPVVTEQRSLTTDSVPNMQTLPFTSAIPRPEDAIPFAQVPTQTEVERVRSGSASSSLTDIVPPLGPTTSSTTSSILRIIEPPPSDDDVIMLTTKKAVDSSERTSGPPQTDEHVVRRMTPASTEAWTWGDHVEVKDEDPRSVTGSHVATKPKSSVWFIVMVLMIAAFVAFVLSPLPRELGLY